MDNKKSIFVVPLQRLSKEQHSPANRIPLVYPWYRLSNY